MDELRKALEAIKSAAHAYGIKRLAPDLDKAPSTLYDELSLSPEAKAKLGCADAIRIMSITEDHRALHIIAAAFGYVLHRPDHMPDAKNFDEECLQGLLAVAAYVDKAKTAKSYLELTPLLESAIKELEDVFVRRRQEELS